MTAAVQGVGHELGRQLIVRIFWQVVDREVPPAELPWRSAADNNGNDRQLRLVLGDTREGVKCSGQVISTRRDQRDDQRIRLSRGGQRPNGPPDRLGRRISAKINRIGDAGQVRSKISELLLNVSRQLDHPQPGRLGGVGGKDVRCRDLGPA